MKQCLKFEIGLPYVSFNDILDYIILVCYYLKLLKVSKTELKAFVREFEKITSDYTAKVDKAIATKVIHPKSSLRLASLKKYI